MIRYVALTIAIAALGLTLWHADAADPVPATAKISTSVDECRVCHSWDGNREKTDQPLRGYLALVPGIAAKNASDKFITLNESLTVDQHDPHTKAFSALRDKLGQEMNERLKKLKIEKPYSDVTQDTRCLTCHAMDLKPTAKEKQLDQFIRGDVGIGCAACHGVGQEWQYSHYSTGKDPSIVGWRSQTPEAKAKCGQRNLRDPAVKAQLCASCHVGNAAEGKVVTHDMYAAGHPPLPPLELVTYMNDEPKHWKYPSELDYFKDVSAADCLAKFSFHKVEGAEGYTARHIAIGFIVSLKHEMELMAAEAKSQKSTGAIDLARFDCYACHHDLSNTDRQNRGYSGAPGRPPLKAWNANTVQVVVDHLASVPDSGVAAKAAEFKALWDSAMKAVMAQPYGKPDEVVVAADKLAAWCGELVAALEKVEAYRPDSAAKLNETIQKALADVKVQGEPESVMALIWASRALKPDSYEKAAGVIPLSLRTKEQVWAADQKPVAVGAFTRDRMKLFYSFSASKFRDAMK